MWDSEESALGILTDKDAIGKLHLFPLPATARAGLARWKEAICQEEHLPVPQAFVLDLLAKLSHADITNGTRQFAVALHPIDMQIFQDNHLGTKWRIGLGAAVNQLFDLFLGFFLLGLGFRSGQKRGKMGLEADAFARRQGSVGNGTRGLVQGIFSNVSNSGMQTSHLLTGFLTIL